MEMESCIVRCVDYGTSVRMDERGSEDRDSEARTEMKEIQRTRNRWHMGRGCVIQMKHHLMRAYVPLVSCVVLCRVRYISKALRHPPPAQARRNDGDPTRFRGSLREPLARVLIPCNAHTLECKHRARRPTRRRGKSGCVRSTSRNRLGDRSI